MGKQKMNTTLIIIILVLITAGIALLGLLLVSVAYAAFNWLTGLRADGDE